MDFGDWLQIAFICLIGAAAPGLSFGLVVTNTISKGKLYGVATGIGHGIGIWWWAFLSAIGIVKILADHSLILQICQLLGACILVYIGLRTITQGNVLAIRDKTYSEIDKFYIFRGASEGFLLAIFNPKIALFFLAIFSHFIRLDFGWTEASLLSVTAASIDALWYVSLALVVTSIRKVSIFRNNGLIISRSCGALLTLTAVYLIVMAIK